MNQQKSILNLQNLLVRLDYLQTTKKVDYIPCDMYFTIEEISKKIEMIDKKHPSKEKDLKANPGSKRQLCKWQVLISER